jgi:CheY-like chemotaxis protein
VVAVRSRPLRVLVVDDCPDTRKSLGVLLEHWGHEPRLAPDGGMALREAEQSRPDIVLLDIAMPGMSGWEVARRLRERPQLRDTLIIALTGFGRDHDRNLSRAAGCDHHLLKPVDPQALAQFLERARHEQFNIQPDEMIALLTDSGGRGRRRGSAREP